MAKNLTESLLLDFYGELLTEKQQKALTLYYYEDLSLAEIAEEMNVSRQGVRAFIKQGEAHLAEFEEKLKLSEKFSKISALTALIKEKIPENQENTEILAILSEIENNL